MAIISSSYSATLSIKPTDWSNSISLPQFDQSIYGTLLGMDISVAGTFRSIARVENVTTLSAAVVISGASGSLVVYDASGSALVSTSPIVAFTNSLAAYDNLADYGGSSGVSNARRSATGNASASVGSFSDYIGTGTAIFRLTASASGFVYGLENFLLQINPDMGATVTVKYIYEEIVVAGGISGTVFNDYNGNGVMEPGEGGIEGVTISLLDEFGLPVSGVFPVVTDVNGYYEFTGIAAGNYYVVYETPVGYTPTYDLDGVDGSNSFYVNLPTPSTLIDYGNVGLAILLSEIHGTVFNDVNGSGIFDLDEVGMSDITIELWNETEDTLISTTTTDVNGLYSFTSISDGTYYIKYYPPSGYVATYDGDTLGPDNKIAVVATAGSYFELIIGLYTEGLPPTTSSIWNPIDANGSVFVYDLKKLVSDRVVGNVFYKNGKFIFSNSGSVFDDLLKDRTNLTLPKYDITYKSKQTIYEKQILCRIEPGEFNFSTNPTALLANTFEFDIDKNSYFNYADLDLILSYINLKINNDYNWYNYLSDMFTDSDDEWYIYYSKKHNILNKDYSYYTPYHGYLDSIYTNFDVDGNKKIKMTDAYLMFKYFTNTLTKDVVFKYVDVRSARKSVESITRYLDEKTGKNGYGNIKPEFFQFDISSSLDKTGSYLAPFITTVGLYSGADLVAVAKLGMPIKNSGELPLNILVKWDI